MKDRMKSESLLVMFKWLLFLPIVFICFFMLYVSVNKYWHVVFPEPVVRDTLGMTLLQYVDKNGGWVVNTSTRETVLKGFAAPSEDPLGIFKRDERFGFYDTRSGEQTIAPIYESVSCFSEGLAAVTQKGKMGFIDRQGNVQIGFRFFDDVYTRMKLKGTASSRCFRNGKCVMVNEDVKFGVIDRNGSWVIKPEYEWLGEEQYGFRVAKLGGKYGAVNDSTGRMAIPAEFDAVTLMPDCVIVERHYEYRKILSYDGIVLKNETYESLDTLKASPDYQVYHIGTGVGLVKKNGRKITPPSYCAIKDLGNGLFLCTMPDEYVGVLIDGNGNKVY